MAGGGAGAGGTPIAWNFRASVIEVDRIGRLVSR